MSRRLGIVRGAPTREELAAVVAALAVADDEDAQQRIVPVVPAWLRAARLESTGRGVAAAPTDLPPPAS